MAEVQIKRTFPMTVAYIAMEGPFSQIGEGFGRLYAWMEAQGYSPAGMPVGCYMSDPEHVPQEDLVWELWVPVEDFAEPRKPDSGGIGIKRVGPMSVASVMHRGPYEKLAPVYADLARWIAENSHKVVGPPMEVYYTDSEDTLPEEYLTELQMPIAG